MKSGGNVELERLWFGRRVGAGRGCVLVDLHHTQVLISCFLLRNETGVNI